MGTANLLPIFGIALKREEERGSEAEGREEVRQREEVRCRGGGREEVRQKEEERGSEVQRGGRK